MGKDEVGMRGNAGKKVALSKVELDEEPVREDCQFSRRG